MASQQCWGVTLSLRARHNSSNVGGVTTGQVRHNSSNNNICNDYEARYDEMTLFGRQ